MRCLEALFLSDEDTIALNYRLLCVARKLQPSVPKVVYLASSCKLQGATTLLMLIFSFLSEISSLATKRRGRPSAVLAGELMFGC